MVPYIMIMAGIRCTSQAVYPNRGTQPTEPQKPKIPNVIRTHKGQRVIPVNNPTLPATKAPKAVRSVRISDSNGRQEKEPCLRLNKTNAVLVVIKSKSKIWNRPAAT